MIIQFSVGNFRSFNAIQNLNLRATALVSENKQVDENNIIEIDNLKILKTVGIYGPNGSGKSNLIRALETMRRIVTASLDSESSEAFMDPFILGDEFRKDGGYFQLSFLLNGRKYRFGFTLTSAGTIYEEWLFGTADKNETYFFKRAEGDVQVNQERFPEGLNLPEGKLRKDALFLSFCSGYNGEISKNIRNYFRKAITFDRNMIRSRQIIGLPSSHNRTDQLYEQGKKDLILLWLKEAGIFYSDMEIVYFGSPADRSRILFYKSTLGERGTSEKGPAFDFDVNESDGTKKFYRYIGRLYHIFENGGVLCSDEIDANFHPSLLQKLISLFNNSEVNKAGAQLIFTSHDTNLLNPDILRRDQFYFTEKSMNEETLLYSLADLNGIRNNADFARQYLAGFYGALPILGNYLEQKEQ